MRMEYNVFWSWLRKTVPIQSVLPSKHLFELSGDHGKPHMRHSMYVFCSRIGKKLPNSIQINCLVKTDLNLCGDHCCCIWATLNSDGDSGKTARFEFSRDHCKLHTRLRMYIPMDILMGMRVGIWTGIAARRHSGSRGSCTAAVILVRIYGSGS